MDIITNLNFCKLFFATITTFMVVVGCLINLFEPYLPLFIVKSYRYGKFASKEDSALANKVEIPKSYFRHFYLSAVLICCPITLHQVWSAYRKDDDVSNWFRTLLLFSCGPGRKATTSAMHTIISVILMVLQITRRFYDTHFVSVFSKTATINLSHYFIGMVFYPAVLLIILSEAPKFVQDDTSDVATRFHLHDIGILEISAVVIFLWAWYHQHVSTVILANLRKNNRGDIVSQSYNIPEGDWFQYLSSPHSIAEIIMYTALTLLLSNNTGWWYVYTWVLSNQVETILLSHWWYQSHFKNFPRERKALVPFIY